MTVWTADDTSGTGIRCDFVGIESGTDASTGRHVLGRVDFQGTAGTAALQDGVPRLGLHMSSEGFDSFSEIWSTGAAPTTGEFRGLVFAHDGDYLFCAGHIPERGVYRDTVRESYEAAFQLIDELGYRHVFRMWNFISRINEDNAEGLEVYRDFCLGRAEAFEARGEADVSMPAATGIGSQGGGIAFFFLASREGSARHIENHRQVPAYKYPQVYGPKPPSFARATHFRAAGGDEAGAVFVSGTASILGHQTVHQGDIRKQCEVTLANIAELIGPDNLAANGIERGHELKELRYVKAYIRHAEDLAVVREKCAEVLPADTELVCLNVDVCREDLLVEIEGVVPGSDWGI